MDVSVLIRMALKSFRYANMQGETIVTINSELSPGDVRKRRIQQNRYGRYVHGGCAHRGSNVSQLALKDGFGYIYRPRVRVLIAGCYCGNNLKLTKDRS